MFDLCCTVWGKPFCDKLLQITLPTLMAPGNLPDWPWLKTSQLIIYTTAPDRDYLMTHLAIQKLAQLMPIAWRLLEDIAPPWEQLPDNTVWRKYYWMSAGDAHAIGMARADNHALIRWFPDGIYSMGSFIHLAHLIQNGKELVFLYVPRLREDIWTPRLIAQTQQGMLSLTAPQCVDIMSQPLHAETASYFWYSPTHAGQNPRLVFYAVDDHTFESHCADVDVVYMQHPRPFESIIPGTNHTMDMDYVHQYADWLGTPQESKIALIQNNEMVFIALSAEEPYMVAFEQALPFNLRPGHVWRFLKHHRANPMRQWLFRHVIRWTGTAKMRPDYPVELYQQTATQAPWKMPVILSQIHHLLECQNYHALANLATDPTIQAIWCGHNDTSLHPVLHTLAEALLVKKQWAEARAFIAKFRHPLRNTDWSLESIRPLYSGYLPRPFLDGSGFHMPLQIKSPYIVVYLPQYPHGTIPQHTGSNGVVLLGQPQNTDHQQWVHSQQQQFPQLDWHLLDGLNPCPGWLVSEVLFMLLYQAHGLVLPESWVWSLREAVLYSMIVGHTVQFWDEPH